MRRLLPIVLVLFALQAFGESKKIAELRKKAEAGNADAQFNLGVVYLTGKGVPEDDIAAYAWFSLSAYNGFEVAAKYRDDIAKKMPPEQIAKAQELSKELLKKIEANKAKKE